MESLTQTHVNNTVKTPENIDSTICDIKNKIFLLITDENLEKRYKELEKLHEKLSKENWENIQILLKRFKNKEISLDEFKKQREIEENEMENIRNQMDAIKDELKYREIAKNNSSRKKNKKINEIINNLDSIIWENIMKWWSNALWVYEINWENLVLIIKSIWSYKFLWDLGSYYDKIQESKNIPKVLDVFIKNSQTYIIMEKALWKQVDYLNIDELSNIPQKHFDDFIKNMKIINTAWLCIDPSKRSNFFYDETIWFIFIDLQPWKNNFSDLENIILVSILWSSSHPPKDIWEKIKKASL